MIYTLFAILIDYHIQQQQQQQQQKVIQIIVMNHGLDRLDYKY